MHARRTLCSGMRPVHSLAVLALLGVAAFSTAIPAQTVQCRAISNDNTDFAGQCVQGDSVVGGLTLRRPTGAVQHVWVGTLRGARFQSASSSGPVGETEVKVDIRPGGALRLGRSWLALTDVQIERSAVSFGFRFDRTELANDDDVEILTRARSYLSSADRWNRADTTDMATAPLRGFGCAPAQVQSMFCAVYLATLEITKDYAHFRPALNALRAAIGAASKRQYRHPLVDFNNDPATQLSDIHAVLDSATRAVRAERAKRGT